MTDGIINTDTIREIKLMLGPDNPALLGKIIQSFLDDTPQLITAIEIAINDHNAQAIHEAAHRLKSSSISVGADKLAGECGRIESLGKNGMLHDPDLNAEAIRLAFEATIPLFEQYL